MVDEEEETEVDENICLLGKGILWLLLKFFIK